MNPAFYVLNQSFIKSETGRRDLISAQKTRGAIDRSRGFKDFSSFG
jgi:hypothetical protein